MNAIPRIKGDRILSQINPLSIENVKDFFDHREEASRFIGIASALLADDTDIQWQDHVTNLQRDRQYISTFDSVVLLFRPPLIAIRKGLGISRVIRIVYCDTASRTR